MAERGEGVLGLFAEGEERPRARVAAAPRRDEETPAVFEVSVIVPARDEERSIEECLRSLVAQSEPGFALGAQWELIVVDDGSTDGTRAVVEGVFGEVAEAGDGLVLLEAPRWEAGRDGSGMTGKSAACWAAAGRARGAWLLFTDADTVHAAGSVSRSLREAERHEVALLTYSPRQVTTGFLQLVTMPLIFSELASVYPPAEVNDPGRPIAAANGQFLLVQREAYFDVGGHRRAGMDLLEDVALARAVKRAGQAIRLRNAPEAVAARMYRMTGEMVEGWTKNLALLMPSPVALTLWRLLDIVLLLGLPAVALGWPGLLWWQQAAIGLIWVRTLFRFYNRVARAHAGVLETALSPLGLPMFCFLLLRSTYRQRVQREVVWKGRRYNPNKR